MQCGQHIIKIYVPTRTIQYGLTTGSLIIKQCGNESEWEKGSSSAWAREAVRRGAEALFVNRVKHTLSSIIFHTLTYTPGHGVIVLANVSKYAHPENGRVRLYRLLLVRHSEKKTLYTRSCAHRGENEGIKSYNIYKIKIKIPSGYFSYDKKG